MLIKLGLTLYTCQGLMEIQISYLSFISKLSVITLLVIHVFWKVFQIMFLSEFFVIHFLFLSFLSLIVIMIENDIKRSPLNLIVYSQKKKKINKLTIHQVEQGITTISKLFILTSWPV